MTRYVASASAGILGLRRFGYYTDGAGSAPFSPLSLSPALWIDPSDASSVTISGSSGAYIGPTGLVITSSAGSAANGADTPYAAYMNVAGDLDIALQVVLGTVPPAAWSTLLTRWEAVQQSFLLDYKNTGVLTVTYKVGGSNVTCDSTVTVASAGYSTGNTVWLRVYRNSTTGDVKFYTAAASSSIPSSWTQLGATVAGTSGAMTASTSNFYVGQSGASPAGPKYPCTHMRVLLYSGDMTGSGTKIYDADFVAATDYVSSFTESSSNAATVTVTSSTGGALVSQINDKSGNTNHLTQGTAANMPKYVSVGGINWLLFDGTNDNLAKASFTTAQPYVIAAVGRLTTAGATSRQLVSGGGYVYQDTTAKFTMYAGTATVAEAAASDTVAHAFSFLHNGASSTLRKDGTQTATGNPGSAGWSAAQLTVGANASAANAWLGYGGEIAIFPSALTVGNQQLVEAYLKAKWGTP